MPAELTWYITRASGLVAWALLAVAVLWGLLLSSRVLERRPSPAWLLDLHRHLGWLTVTLTAVHVVALYLDDFVDLTVGELLVPFASDYEDTGSALGVLALWLLAVVQTTSWLRGRIPLRSWRALHALSAPLLVLATAHGLMVGTDLGNPVVTIAGLVLAAEVVLVLALRLVWGRRSALPSALAPE